MERTVVLVKPDGYEKKLAGEVLSRLEKLNLQLRACKLMRLSEAQLRAHYAHLVDKPFFGELRDFMQTTPVLAMVLEGPNAVQRVRDLVGATDPAQADKGTIRAEFGADKMRNIVHASDAVATAEEEVKRFFAAEEVF